MPYTVTTTIRDRGQITLPSPIRARFPWLTPNSPLQITTTANAVVLLPPHQATSTPWNKIWDALHLAHTFTGKQSNLSQFILQDRSRH